MIRPVHFKCGNIHARNVFSRRNRNNSKVNKQQSSVLSGPRPRLQLRSLKSNNSMSNKEKVTLYFIETINNDKTKTLEAAIRSAQTFQCLSTKK